MRTFNSPLLRFRQWLERLSPSPLALWGKLPTHADYLRHGTSPEAARAWQGWLVRHAPGPARRAAAPGGAPWLHLTPEPADLRAVPVAFVLPPGTLAFSGRRHVVGVIAESRDSLGRRHPLLIYRSVALAWVLEHAVRGGLPWWHAQAQLAEHWTLLAETRDASEGATLSWPRLCQTAMQLDAAPHQDTAGLHATLLDHWPARPLPTSHHLHGVRHLPWALWPAGEHSVAHHAAFWQQDGDGGVVSAASTLAGVFRHGRRP